jgi:hypothetical protein
MKPFFFTVQTLMCGAFAVIYPAWAVLFVALTGLSGAAAGYWLCIWALQRSQQNAVRAMFIAISEAAEEQNQPDRYTFN